MTALHQVKVLQVIAPKYTTSFQCVGAECPDSCCSGWRVDIDKKTHRTYTKIVDPDLKPLFASNLQRTRGTESEARYAKISLEPSTGDCPFLQQSICSIQKKLGEDKLSHTCFQYPRSTLEVGGVRQHSMTMSCPQAARLALTNDDSMEFVSTPINNRSDVIAKHSVLKLRISPESINGIRFALIRLVRGKAIPLWQRLAALGVVCELIGDFSANGKSSELTQIIEQFERTLSTESLSDVLDGQKADHASQSVGLISVWKLKSFRGTSKRQRLVQDEVLHGLGYGPDSSEVEPTAVVARYADGLNIFEETLATCPSLLENFVLNEMFREVFPFGSAEPIHHYRLMVVKYGVVRLMLAARCRYHQRALTFDEAIETIQVFSRLYEHAADFGEQVDKILSRLKLDSTADLYKFLKPA